MKTTAVRLYGENDLRLESFDLPEMGEDEILCEIVSDSVCMSTYKEAIQGTRHKRVPEDIATKPIIIGHEFSGRMLKVGNKWSGKYHPGDKFAIQPNINYLNKGYAPGYSFPYFGGVSTHIIIPGVVMEKDCLLPYTGDAFFKASLGEPMSCIVAAFLSSYHTNKDNHLLSMGTKKGGIMALMAGVGPMGLGALDYALHCDNKPSVLVVTDIDDQRLSRAKRLFTPEKAAKDGIKLVYINTSVQDAREQLMALSGGVGYDDVFVFAPVKPVVEMADSILGMDGCLNFFAGPTDKNFKAEFNFYNVHYAAAHIVGTSGGNTDDLKIALDMMSKARIDPAVMVTHIGGIDSAISTTLNLPKIPGGKKLIYVGIEMELTALDDLEIKGKTNPLFAKLADIVKKNNGLWSKEAEEFLLKTKQKVQL